MILDIQANQFDNSFKVLACLEPIKTGLIRTGAIYYSNTKTDIVINKALDSF